MTDEPAARISVNPTAQRIRQIVTDNEVRRGVAAMEEAMNDPAYVCRPCGMAAPFHHVCRRCRQESCPSCGYGCECGGA